MDEIVAVITDLFFQSRIAAAAHHARCSVRYVGSVSALAGIGDFQLALVDLDARLDVLSVIRHLRSVGSGQIVAFGPHVDTEGRKAARSAGADRVLAKSKFVTELPTLMGSLQADAVDTDAR